MFTARVQARNASLCSLHLTAEQCPGGRWGNGFFLEEKPLLYLFKSFGSEITMSRIIIACSFTAALLASGTVNANQSDWQKARLACADVGIDPSSAAFGQCVFNLYYSLWNEENVSEH
jgi:hypothetical protein